jgi:DNA replication protein DnaC
MLTHPTLDQLRALKLDGMADTFLELEQQDAAKDLTHADWLALLLDREITNRATKRAQIRLRAARLRYSQASVEDVNYRAQRQLDKTLFQQLAACRWIADKRNLLLVGKCGLGKTWLACALAQKACREGYSAYYMRMPRLFAQLELAHGDGSYARLFRTLTRVNLLLLDDLGPDRLNASQRRDLMEIIEERHSRGSTLIASQLPVKAWHDLIGEPTFADAILDRLVHNAYRLELEGQRSMREPEPDGQAQTPMPSAANPKPAKGARK